MNAIVVGVHLSISVAYYMYTSIVYTLYTHICELSTPTIDPIHKEVTPLGNLTQRWKIIMLSVNSNQSLNICSISGWWLGHPSEKYESQLG